MELGRVSIFPWECFLPAVETIHDRMPLIIPPQKYGQWLNGDTTIEAVREMLIPYAGKLESYPVSTLVNKPSNEGADCLDKAPSV